jgi:hypothetical protein
MPQISVVQEHHSGKGKQNKKIHFRLVPFLFCWFEWRSSPLHSLGGLRGVHLLAILVVANPWGRSTVAAAFTGTDTVESELVWELMTSEEAHEALKGMHTERSCRE